MAHSEKEYMVKEISKHFKDSSGLIIANFDKIGVVEMNELRRKLEKHSSRLIVSKNTLLKKAMAEAKYKDAGNFFEGATGIAVYKDNPVFVAKTLFEFSKSHENFKVRGAIIDGELMDEKNTKILSELPPKDVLRAMVLGALNAPISGLVNVLSGTFRGLVVALHQISEKKK